MPSPGRAEALRIGEQFFGSSRFAAAPPTGAPPDRARLTNAPDGDTPAANLALAHALLDRDDRAGAAVALARAESAFREGSAPPELWFALAQAYGPTASVSARS